MNNEVVSFDSVQSYGIWYLFGGGILLAFFYLLYYRRGKANRRRQFEIKLETLKRIETERHTQDRINIDKIVDDLIKTTQHNPEQKLTGQDTSEAAKALRTRILETTKKVLDEAKSGKSYHLKQSEGTDEGGVIKTPPRIKIISTTLREILKSASPVLTASEIEKFNDLIKVDSKGLLNAYKILVQQFPKDDAAALVRKLLKKY